MLRSSRSAFGNSLKPATMSSRRSAAALPAVAALRMKPARCWRCAASGVRIVSLSLASWASCLFCSASVARTLSVSCSAGSARRTTAARSGPRAARPAPRSLRISRKRSTSGSRVMLLDEVEVDLLAVVLDRQPVLAGAGLAVGDLLERRRRLAARRARLRRLALDVLLAEQRLRPDQAGGVAQEVLEAGIGDAEHGHRLAWVLVAVSLHRLIGQRDRDVVDGADRRAGDPDVLAVDEEAGVVEVGADLVVAAAVTFAGGGRGDQRRDDAQTDDYGQDPSHGPGSGPGGSQPGLQSDGVRSLFGQAGPTNGFELSGAGADPPPGQRSLPAGGVT